MKEFIRDFFLSKGLWLQKTCSEQEVLKFISMLRPVQIDRPLRRVGPDRDGGYLVPDDLDQIAACISPGVSTEVGFDKDIADRGIDVIMCDASVDRLPVHHDRFKFIKKFVDVQESEQTVTLESLCNMHKEGDLLLQMDIEGAEYRTLLSTGRDCLSRFRIMIIEFHDLKQIVTPFDLKMISAVFQKLLVTHEIVHIHPNNCARPVQFGPIAIPSVMEFTFYRKDRVQPSTRAPVYPHPLDADNVAGRPAVVLPRCWYQ
jgi:hypothetical protein